MTITQEQIREVLDYNPDTGHLTWKVARGHRRVGDRAGGIDITKGYRSVRVLGKAYKEHRLIWLWYTGSFPKDHMDHINGVRDDNRIANLRECTNQENSQNRTVFNNPKKRSKYIGVSYRGKLKGNQWRARIMLNNKDIELGYFNTEEEAHQAYVEAKAVYHTFQPTVNIKETIAVKQPIATNNCTINDFLV